MKRLIRFEIRKILGQKRLYVCTGIMLLLMLLVVLSVNAVTLTYQIGAGLTGIDAMLISAASGSFSLIGGIFVALTVCEDFEQQTIKLVCARGNSRRNVCLAKGITIGGAVTAMFIVLQVFSFLLASLYFGTGEMENGKVFLVLGVQYIAYIAELSMVFMVSMHLRKNSSSVAAVILIPIIVNIVLGLIESIYIQENVKITRYWVSNLNEGLTNLYVSASYLKNCTIAAVIWLVLFAVGSLQINKKRDL